MLWQTSATLRRRLAAAGFTLIELMVVIVIIAILVSISVGYLTDLRRRARNLQVAANLNEIVKALESFATDTGGMYPFRLRYFEQATVDTPGFDPYEMTDLAGTGMTSDATDWFSLGLIGGVRVVTDTFADNTGPGPSDPGLIPPGGYGGMQEHHVIQPFGWAYDVYKVFNQYSDPLYALGYLGAYPPNPFLKRPMGNIAWAYGPDSTGNLNHTIPSPDVVVTPGDFCYTFFYGASGTTAIDPQGIVECKRSYQAKSPTTTHDGMYYVDVIDSYQMWAYGSLPLNGPTYVCYPNNAGGLATRNMHEARKDWDNSGTKDMFEIGLVAYYKRTGSGASQSTTATGSRLEF